MRIKIGAMPLLISLLLTGAMNIPAATIGAAGVIIGGMGDPLANPDSATVNRSYGSNNNLGANNTPVTSGSLTASVGFTFVSTPYSGLEGSYNADVSSQADPNGDLHALASATQTDTVGGRFTAESEAFYNAGLVSVSGTNVSSGIWKATYVMSGFDMSGGGAGYNALSYLEYFNGSFVDMYFSSAGTITLTGGFSSAGFIYEVSLYALASTQGSDPVVSGFATSDWGSTASLTNFQLFDTNGQPVLNANLGDSTLNGLYQTWSSDQPGGGAPEPASNALMTMGLAGLAYGMRRRLARR